MNKLKLAVLAVLVAAGCKDEVPTAAPEKAGPGPHITTTINMPTDVATVAATACWHCHNRPTESDNPLNIKITPGNPWTISNVTGQMLHDAFRFDQAPADVPLTSAQRDIMEYWTVNDLGASGSSTIPSSFSWDQDTHQSGLTIPGDGYQDHGYEGQRLEDRQKVNLTISNYTTNDGVNHDWLKIQTFTGVSADSSASDDPVVYIFPSGVAWQNRLQEFEIHMDIQFQKRFFIVAHVERMRKGPSAHVDSVRSRRKYIRLQVESDSDLGLRTKDTNFPTGIGEEEVGDWSNGPADPHLTAETGYTLIDQPGTPAVIQERAYHLCFTGTKSGSTFHYVGQYWDADPAVDQNANMLSEVRGYEGNASQRFGGWMIGFYERHGTGKWNAMGGATIEGTLKGAGTGQGQCVPCELDR